MTFTLSFQKFQFKFDIKLDEDMLFALNVVVSFNSFEGDDELALLLLF